MATFRQTVFQINQRELMLATLMGSLAFAVRNVGLYVQIYPPFRFDPRWVFSLLAACWAGPAGGLIAGTLAAMKLPYPLIDLAAIPAHFFIGLTSKWLIFHKKSSIYACILWPILGVPLYWLTTLLFTPMSATITLIPILLFIGLSSALLTLAIGLAVEKRANTLLNFLRT
jgi:hypothetical protein